MKYCTYLALIVSLILTACGGGGKGDSSPPSRATGSISGTVFDAPVSGTLVKVWEYKNGKVGRLLGEATTAYDGQYSVAVKTASMPVLIDAEGGKYTDPFSKKEIKLVKGSPLKFQSLINYAEGANQTAMVTPLTYAATGLAKYNIRQGMDSQQAINASNDGIALLYGFNALTVRPSDVIKATQGVNIEGGYNAQNQYGLLLAAYSSYARDVLNSQVAVKPGYVDTDNTYTSAYLARVQYEDVLANGKMDGQFIDNGGEVNSTFGSANVTADTYSEILAQHIMIAANELDITTDFSVYSKQVQGKDDDTSLDSTPPSIDRAETRVLLGKDLIEFNLSDNIGVKNASARLAYKLDEQWHEIDCSESNDFCELDKSEFHAKKRATKIKVIVETKQLDNISRDTSEFQRPRVNQAKLYVTVEDTNTTANQSTEEFTFKWDNEKPIVTITSADTISSNTYYNLEGSVEDEFGEISQVKVFIQDAEKETLNCTKDKNNDQATGRHKCIFASIYENGMFGSGETEIKVTAADKHGYIGEATKIVKIDRKRPRLEIGYPSADLDFVIDRKVTTGNKYDAYTFTNENIDEVPYAIKADKYYVEYGVARIPNVNLKHFTPEDLVKNNSTVTRQIPYITATVCDEGDQGSGLASKPKDITLSVTHYTKQRGGNWQKHGETLETSIDDEENSALPYAVVNDDLTYYIPFTKDVMKSTSTNRAHKLVISARDEAGNTSEQSFEVYYKLSYNLPKIKVVTPFINASVNLQVPDENGLFKKTIGTCDTKPDQSSPDVASCVINVQNPSASQIYRLQVLSDEAKNTHYYGWGTSNSDKPKVDLGTEAFAVYFKGASDKTFYITELASYHSGLFDYQWNNSNDKNVATAEAILEHVSQALAGSDSFFGFDPTITPYETNLEASKREETVGSLNNSQRHRLLVESFTNMAAMASSAQVVNSVEFAKRIYADLSSDGKADGKLLDSEGKTQPVVLESYEFTTNTYTKDLANFYYYAMTGEDSFGYFTFKDLSLPKRNRPYTVEKKAALIYADKVATANPKFFNKEVIAQQGLKSIDNKPPQIVIDSGVHEITVADKTYVTANKMVFTVTATDPAEIGKVEIKVFYKQNEASEEFIKIDPLNIVKDPTQQGKYSFELDTSSDQYSAIKIFKVEVDATDNKKNAGKATKEYHLDKTPPVVILKRPNEDGKEDVYLSAAGSQYPELTFKIEDQVGDDKQQRLIQFSDVSSGTDTTERFTHQKFSGSAESEFKVKLCSSDNCDGKTIKLEDGEWELKVKAVDKFGQATQLEDFNPFKILIDSTPPVITDLDESFVLAANATWKPPIQWGNGAAGQEVKIELQKPNGVFNELIACNVRDKSDCLKSYITDKVEVQLVAEDLKDGDGKTHKFRVKASDSAYPPNTSKPKVLSFILDGSGPILKLLSPWIKDTKTESSLVIGKDFSFKFASAEDPSGVKIVNIYQRVNEQLVKLKSWSSNNPDWWKGEFKIEYLLPADPNIEVNGESKVTFVIEAVDNNGFSTQLEAGTVILDTIGPTLRLGGHQPNEYYSSGYKFTVNAEDYAQNGVITSAGVDKNSLQYWFNDQDNSRTQVKEEEGNYYITLPSVHADGDMKLSVSGKDIRGNERVKHFPLKISNSAPQLSNLNILYANGQKVEGAVTRTGDIKITLDAQDNSGIANVDLLIKYNGDERSQEFKFNDKDKYWQTTLSQSTLQRDGEYSLNIKAYNKVKVASDQNAKFSEMDHNLSVQRQGVELLITKPTPFSSHVSGKTLSAEFAVQNHVQPKQIQCWIRENYTSTEAPQDRDMYTSGEIKLNLDEAPRCSITSNEDFNQNPVLIVETLGQNDATNVQLFSFKQLDSQPPTPDFTQPYSVTAENIIRASGGKPKQFSMALVFTDDMSGVNINNGTWPILEKGFNTFEPTGCESRQNRQFRCTYTWDYSRFTDWIQPKLTFDINGLRDNAGNIAKPYPLELVLPNKAPEVSINIADNSSELPQYTIVKGGEEYTVILKTILAENSRIDEIKVEVGDRVYSSSNQQDRDAFNNVECDNATCKGFTFNVPDKIEQFNLTVTVKDVFGLKGEGSVDNLRVDKDDPTIGSIQSIERRGENIRFTFDISDQTSGLSEVTYKVKGIETPIIKQEQGKGEALYFELKASDLGLEPLTVDIIAKDKVGRSSLTWGKKINLTLPQISLTLSPETNFVGERLAVKDEKLSVTLNSENEGSVITAKSYSVMVAGSELEGEFSDTSWPLEIGINSDRQGQSSLIIKVTDSLGREITEFNYSDKEYDAGGIPVLVDFADPDIKNLSARKSGMVKEEGKYPVKVTAEVSNLHLRQVTAVLLNDKGTQVSQVSLERSDDNVYTPTLNVAAGDYQVKVVALDRAGRKSEQKTDVTVEESPTPTVSMSLLDATSGNALSGNEIGGGQGVTLVLTFSEAVKEFDSGDVLMRIGDEEYGLASLKDFKAMGVDDKQWQASYTTPSDTDTKVTFKIENDSYLSVNNIPGNGAELVLDIKGTKPEVSSVELPDSATVRDTINVSVTFTEEVTKPSGSTFGDAAVTWSEGDELREVWTGQVTVPSTDASTLKLNLSIKGYQDKYANVGVENTNKSVSLNHVLSINSIDNVGQNSPKSIDIGGQWAHLKGQLTLTLSSKNDSISENVPLSGNGTWGQAVSIEDLPQGRITVTVSGNNAKGEAVTGEEQTFIFDAAAPVIDDELLTVSRDDDNGTVTLGFDIQDKASDLSQVTYQFNGKEIVKDSTDKTQLSLAADDLVGKDELKVTIKAEDTLGQTISVERTINVAQPEVSLSLQGAADLTEGGLSLTQLPQSITLTAPSAEGSVVNAAGYSMTLVPSGEGKESTVKQGTFTHGRADIEIKENELEQGEFALRLVVTDSLGREITEFNYSDKEYDAGGIPVLVDFADPDIKNLSARKSGMVKEEGKYPVKVTAEVSDLHLRQVTAVLLNDKGKQVSQVSLEPSDDNVYTPTLNVAAGDYQVKVVALDRAGRKSEQKTDVTVEESPTPTVSMSLLDATSGNALSGNEIGGGQGVTLVLTFSEAVKEFDSGDVLMRIGDEEYGLASLKDFKAMGVDDKQWQASYTTPSDTDTKVTFKIENDSYLSVNNIPGNGAELVLDIKGTKPEVSSVELPDSATVRDTINVSVTFTEEVTKPSGSTLGNAPVTWSEGDDFRRTWIGEVTVPSTDISKLKLVLSIGGYQDKYANSGVVNTDYHILLNPVLSINSIANVGQNSGKTIVIEGQWAHLDAPVTLTLSSQNSSITEKVTSFSPDGTWHQEVSIDSLTQGLIKVTVSGNNAEGQKVEGEKQTFTFDAAAPVINEEFLEISYDNNHATFGFDIQDAASGLSQVTYQFNDKEIVKDSADKTQLSLAADDLAGKDELKVTIKAEDTLGQTFSVERTINVAQPEVSLSLQGPADLIDGALPLTQLPQSMTLTAPSASGSVVNATGYSMTLVPSDESGNTVTLSELKLPSGSTDSTAEFNLAASQIPQGEFTLRLVVTDSLGREIEQFTYSDETYGARGIPVLVDFVDPEVSNVDWQKPQASAGEAVEFTVTFSEAGSTLGDEAVNWSGSDELSQEWLGQVTLPSELATNLESLTLLVKGHADRAGNPGGENRDYSLPLTPPVEIPDNSGTEDSLETPREDSELSELDPGSSESEIEETRLAA
ncbi:hypothetical protein ACN3E9_03480 [Vibrio pectenicida]|uniref:hypothetical protein n=1 Tax=Vibrio pectenicida TaxID=62763 RepID=UPI003B9D097E